MLGKHSVTELLESEIFSNRDRDCESTLNVGRPRHTRNRTKVKRNDNQMSFSPSNEGRNFEAQVRMRTVCSLRRNCVQS